MGAQAKGFLWSVAIHATLIIALLLSGIIGGCRLRKQPLEIKDFTIAIDPSGVEEEPPPQPKPEVKPPPTPPKPDDIVQQKPKPKLKPKPEEKKKPEPKKPEPKKEPPKPEIKKGKRVNRKIDPPVKPKERQTLSDAEIEKWLAKRARIGEKTSLPKNELSLNASILKNCLYDAWTPPPKSASGYRPAVVSFKISQNGALFSPRIVESSGSATYDNSCLEAVRRVARVPDLSQAFIREYGADCPFEFKQAD
jgi:colicin import membrane protein